MSEHRRFLKALWKLTFPLGQKKPQKMSPQELLDSAKREMEETHLRNRKRAVQTITQQKNLEQMAYDLERKLLQLDEQIADAEREGKPERAARLRHEKSGWQVSRNTVAQSLEKATEAAEVVKAHIQKEQEEIRKKMAQILAMQSDWKTGAITQHIERQLKSNVHQIFDESYTLYPLKAARDVVAVLLGVIALLLFVVAFLVLR
ncbi:MAG: hypothetical protein QM758_03565 [Armatimonas sp.]